MDESDPKRAKLEAQLDDYVRQCLARMDGDVEKAAGLFFAWSEQNSQVREPMQLLVKEAIEARVARLAEAES